MAQLDLGSVIGPSGKDGRDGKDGKDGITSFNGRTGEITPQSGDYTAEMVEARPDTWLPTAEEIGAAQKKHTHDVSEITGYSAGSDTPIDHASAETTYGVGTSSLYGHVKLSDSTKSEDDENSGIAATPKAVKFAYDLAQQAQTVAEEAASSASDAKSTAENAQSDATTAKSSADEAKDLAEEANQTAATAQSTAETAKQDASNARSLAESATQSISELSTSVDQSKAPINHASTDMKYGVGDASNYGHVKLSDSTDNDSDVSANVAATPFAVKSVMQSIVDHNVANDCHEDIRKRLVGEQILDNWFLAEPINQRGETEYTKTTTAGSMYHIDRWACWSRCKITVGTDGLVLEKLEETDAPFIFQRFETGLQEKLRGKTVTLSFLVKGKGTVRIGNANDSSQNKDFSIDSENYELISNTYVWPNTTAEWYNSVHISMLANENAVITILAAKLELGSVQTLAYKEGDTWVLNDPPPNKALELAKCQRYQVVMNKYFYARAVAINASYIDFVFPIPSTLRANPSVIMEDVIISDQGKIPEFSCEAIAISPGNVTIRATAASGTHDLSDTTAVYVRKNGKLILDANL